MLLLLEYRMLVNGSAGQVAVGFWLLGAAVVALRGQQPFVLETLAFIAESIPGGLQQLNRANSRFQDSFTQKEESESGRRVLSVVMPVGAALLFGAIFVMANPNMVKWVSVRVSELAVRLRELLFQFSASEIVFWAAVVWLTGGTLRPVLTRISERPSVRPVAGRRSSLFPAFRNTLMTVICLFAVYLTVELRTLGFAEFPDGFYYSGYAHEGAAWLTVALTLATLVLSLIFRGRTLQDPRLAGLKRLAWIWSVLNLLLAVAVYNRLWIYIEFNGMTRMRTVGLLGITSVVGGFILVLRKINSGRDFTWLIRRQLWVLGVAVYAYLVASVDLWVHLWNVDQIIKGTPAPVVQITGHDVDDECLRTLIPLCDAEDPVIRRGMQAFLAGRYDLLEKSRKEAEVSGWTAAQLSQRSSLEALESSRRKWDVFSDTAERVAAWELLQSYAYRNWW